MQFINVLPKSTLSQSENAFTKLMGTGLVLLEE